MSNDLISREALIKWIDDSVSQYGHTYSTDMLNMWGLFKDYLINNAPTVDFPDWYKVYEDVKGTFERPTGEWIYDTEHSITIDMYKCSVCGCYGHTHFNFCPNCGANMEGGTDIQKPNCVTCDHFGKAVDKRQFGKIRIETTKEAKDGARDI